MITTFAVEIGDALWMALYEFFEKNYPIDLSEGEEERCRPSKYCIKGIYEEDGQKFVILRERESSSGALYRVNFVYNDEGLEVDSNFVEVKEEYIPVEAETFSLESVEAFEKERYAVVKKKVIEEPKPTYSLEEIPEYVELQSKYSELETNYGALKATNEQLTEQVDTLTAFKLEADRKEKQALIDSFYMLSDEDKKDVQEHIDEYSLTDIENKLSVTCVRNKVSFEI